MANTPTVHTERLTLRRFSLKDAESFLNLINDPKVNYFLPILPFKDLDAATSFIYVNYISKYTRPFGFKYAICLKDTNEFIGYFIVSNNEPHDFGYAIKKDYWGNGYATEAAQAVIELLKDSGIKYITATHDVHNTRSGNILKKLNMTYKYSYVEAWKPKDINMIFRMYQLNFEDVDTYNGYRERYKINFVEKEV